MSTHPPQGLTVVNLDEERHETSPAPKSSRKVYTNWTHPQFRPTALRVALVVGSVLLCINHGAVLIQGKMTRDRWIAAALTYIVPYCVSTHGQWSSQQRRD